MIYHVRESLICVAPSLATPVEPIIQAPQYVPSELHNARVVPINAVVMVIAYKNLVYLIYNLLGLHSSHEPEFSMDFLTFLTQFLTAGFPPYFETSALCL